jgi:hypothetical protein
MTIRQKEAEKMTDEGDVAKRRARLEKIKQRRQSAGGEIKPKRIQPPQPVAKSPELEIDTGGGSAGDQPVVNRWAIQIANLVLRWLETANEPGAETIADTAITREGVANLMAMLSNVERRSGPGAKIAQTLRAFLQRPPMQGEAMVDGVNTEQLGKLITVATRVRDRGVRSRQPSGGQGPDRQGAGRSSIDGGLASGKDDGATTEFDDAFDALDEASRHAPEPPTKEKPVSAPIDGSASGKKQTKHKPLQASRKKLSLSSQPGTESREDL